MNIVKILKFAFGKSKLAQKTVGISKQSVTCADVAHAFGNKKITKCFSVFSGNGKNLSYVPEYKLGDVINSGIEAVVYNVKNYKNLVARVDKNTSYNPFKMKQIENDVLGVIAGSKDGTMTVMKKFEGEPLYGKGWNIRHKPNQNTFESTIDNLNKLPDSTFSKLIDDIINIRKHGFDIDNVNPNNFLLDMKSKKINIVDISESKTGVKGIELDDIIEPLLDYTRIMNLEKISEATKSKIKSFIDRIISIGESKNLCFSMEKLDHSKIQSGLVYLYHNDKKMIDLIRSGYFS